MPTFRPLFPGEVEIEPLIFSFKVDLSDLHMSADEFNAARHRWPTEVASDIVESGGQTYLSLRWIVFFGYPNLPAPLALTLAAQVRQRMSVRYPDATMLSVSTVGLSEHAHIHGYLPEHLNDPALADILLGRIKFKDFDDYLKATGEDLHIRYRNG